MKPSARHFLSTLWNAFLPNNVVLIQALGLCPILAVGINLRYGVALSVCTIVTLVLSDLLFALLAKRIATRLQPLVYVLLSSILLFGSAVVLRLFISAEIYAHLYLFLPLMVVNTLYTYRSVIAPTTARERLSMTLADSLGSAFGFSLVLCIASALREMAIYGTLWDLPLGYEARFPEAEHPFIGFILLGFMAAALQWSKQLLRRKSSEEVGML
ncbi:MAG: hypothetical protein IKU56_04175 [Clostridia bacterium]|nr:hypothetical protein [Clostridia bacterium]